MALPARAKWFKMDRIAVVENEQIPSTRPPGEAGPPPSKEKRLSDSVVHVGISNMDLQTVRSELQRVTTRLRELTNDIARDTRLRAQNS
jgi:hypothetical protein